MLGILKKEEVEQLLQSKIAGRIACCDDGKAHIVPVSFTYVGRYVYCYCAEENKIMIMRKYPEICFEVSHELSQSDKPNWRSVVIYGKYEELAGNEVKKAKQFFSGWQLNSIAAKKGSPNLVFFRIRVEEKIGRFERTVN